MQGSSMMKLKKDQMSSIFLLFVAGVLLISSAEASLGSFREPGSGLVPFLAALLLGILSLANLILSSLRQAGEKEKQIFAFSEMNWKNLIMTLGALFAFPLLLNVLGFNLTVFGFMLFLAKAVEPRRWIIAVLFALSTTIVSYLLFVYWLKFVLEKGIFGI
jgi:putative tricarboxylic transport membrane protein